MCSMDQTGSTALMLACLGHHRTIVARLAAAGAPLCGDGPRHRRAAIAARLMGAVHRHDIPLLETFLEAAGTDGTIVNAADHDGRTALHAAVREQDRTVRPPSPPTRSLYACLSLIVPLGSRVSTPHPHACSPPHV